MPKAPTSTQRPPTEGGAGRRLAGLGITPQQFLAVLARIPTGRAQQRLAAYLTAARDLGATDRDAHLVLAAVEQTIAAAQPVGRLDPYQLAGEVLQAQGRNGGGS
jgi:hypothetical protein